MQKLIDKYDLMDWSETVPLTDDGCIDINDFEEKLKSMPTIDAEPVRHGKWEIEISDYGHQATYRCSECGHQFKWIYNPYFPPVFNYCQKCGAYMRGETNE